MITVIDYGMGNLRSVAKALESLGAKVNVSSASEDIDKAQKVIFPGVGAFSDCMDEVDKRKLREPIKECIAQGKPFLGICMGLQLLFEKSEEAPEVEGLGILKGEVKKFRDESLKIPQIGWNQVEYTQKASSLPIFKDIEDKEFFYFVHSYYAEPEDKEAIAATTNYGIDFPSVISKNNILATQFHPEKSQKSGLKLLDNFLKL
jgi:glutamine amidotransferase